MNSGKSELDAAFINLHGALMSLKQGGDNSAMAVALAIRRLARSELASASAGGGEGNEDVDGKPYTAARLKEILNGRDDFIVRKGLWPEFVASTDAPAHAAQEAGGEATVSINEKVGPDLGKVREALETAKIAIDDWCSTYARDMVGEQAYETSVARIHVAGGTLAYMSRTNQTIDAALSSLPAKETEHDRG